MLRVTRYSPGQNGLWALVATFALFGGLGVSAKAAPVAVVRSSPNQDPGPNLVVQSLLAPNWQPLAAPAPIAKPAASPAPSWHSSDGPARLASSANSRPYLARSVQLVSGRGLADLQTDQVMLGRVGRGAAIDAVRLSARALRRAPLGLVLNPDFGSMGADSEAFDVTYVRGWPSALTIRAGAYDLDITPHAGFGVSDQGSSAEAGATVRLGSSRADARARQVAESLGLKTVDGTSFGDQARLYLYAAASGRALGLNVVRDRETGGFRGSGWSIDPTAALISDAQAGIGLRQGAVQAALGYMHRDIRSQFGVRGMKQNGDSVVALSFAIRPSQ